jgi:type II secretory pathway component PulM
MKLSRRESIIVALGIALVLLVAVEEWVFRPLWSRRQELSARRERAEGQIKALEALLARYRRNHTYLKAAEGRLIREGDNFSLFYFLEEAAGKTGIREKLVAMNPSEASGNNDYRRLEMLIRFEELTMAQVVEYLQRISAAPRLLRVSRMNLERSTRQPGRVTFSASVVAFSAKGSPGKTN